MKLKNRKRTGIQFENEIKKQLKKLDYVLVAQQAKSSFPNLICFGEQIKLLQCKTGRITKTEIEKMVRLIRAIIKIQPILVNIVYGEIKSREKTVWVCPEVKHKIVIRQLKKGGYNTTCKHTKQCV